MCSHSAAVRSASSDERSARRSPFWSRRNSSPPDAGSSSASLRRARILPAGPTPYFVVIDRALRDEGTSYHYAPPLDFAEADGKLVAAAAEALADARASQHRRRDLDHGCAVPRNR